VLLPAVQEAAVHGDWQQGWAAQEESPHVLEVQSKEGEVHKGSSNLQDGGALQHSEAVPVAVVVAAAGAVGGCDQAKASNDIQDKLEKGEAIDHQGFPKLKALLVVAMPVPAPEVEAGEAVVVADVAAVVAQFAWQFLAFEQSVALPHCSKRKRKQDIDKLRRKLAYNKKAKTRMKNLRAKTSSLWSRLFPRRRRWLSVIPRSSTDIRDQRSTFLRSNFERGYLGRS
jgi:hypothetical protein